MNVRTAVITTNAPAPAHSFSQGVRSGPLLQVSGQGPMDPVTEEYVAPGDVAGQTIQTLKNVEAVLAAGGATFDDVMMLRVYLTKREDFTIMNNTYEAFLVARVHGHVLPSRTTVFVGLPHEQMLVEIDALAYIDH